MKKTVLFLIGIICVVSIFVIAFFGTQASFDQFQVYIKTIEITNDNMETINPTSQEKLVRLKFDENEHASVFIDYKIQPANATYKSKISFSFVGDSRYDEETKLTNYYSSQDGIEVLTATIDQKGEIYFHRPGMVKVVVKAEDGGNAQTSVWIMCK